MPGAQGASDKLHRVGELGREPAEPAGSLGEQPDERHGEEAEAGERREVDADAEQHGAEGAEDAEQAADAEQGARLDVRVGLDDELGEARDVRNQHLEQILLVPLHRGFLEDVRRLVFLLPLAGHRVKAIAHLAFAAVEDEEQSADDGLDGDEDDDGDEHRRHGWSP